MSDLVVPSADRAQELTLDDVLELIKRDGGRITASRRFVLEVLFESGGHRSAEEIAEVVQGRAPDVHLSTVYRNLEELERLGVVEHSHFGHGPATYHLTGRAHGHLVCERCGACIEVPDAAFDSLRREAMRRFGFEIHEGHAAILGRCASCR